MKFQYKLYRLLAFLWLFCLSGFAQEYTYRHLSVEDGLASATMSDLFQDSNGYIWMASDQGLVRYDGYQTEIFSRENGLSDNAVLGIYEDQQGVIWFSTLHGLSYYKEGSMHVFAHNNALVAQLKGEQIRSIHKDSQGNIWVDADFHAYQIDSQGGIHDVFKTPARERVLEIKSIPGGAYMTQRATTVFDQVTWHMEHQTVNYQLENQPINIHRPGELELCLLSDGDLMISGSYHVLNLKESGQFEQLVTNGYISSKPEEDQDGILWLGFQQMGAYQDFKGVARLFLEEKTVTDILIDHERGYWFATAGDGVYYLPSLYFNYYHSESYFGKGKIRDISVAEEKLWLGMENGALFKIHQNQVLKEMQFDEIRCMAADEEENLWIAAFYSTFELNEQGKILNEYFISPGCFSIGNNNSVVYVNNHKIYHRNKDRIDIDTLPKEPFSRMTAYLEYDTKLWMGTQTGLWQWDYDTQVLKDCSTEHPYLTNQINAIARLNEEAICVATYGSGLLIHQDDSWYHYGKKDGLTSDFCNGVYVEGNVVWLATSDGVNRLEFTNGFAYPPAYSYYSSNNGLGFRDAKSIRILDDKLWVSGNYGLSVGEIKHLQPNTQAPIVQMKQVRVNGKIQAIQPAYDFAYDQNQLVFDYVGISYQSKGKISYQYRLKGLDEAWTTTENTELHFSGLGPGSYTFELRAKNSDGYWSPVNSALTFTIATPFWKNTWFILSCIASISILVLYIFKRRFEALEETNKLMQMSLESEQKALRTQITPHFMFNALNSIQWLIANNDKFSAIESTARFARLMRNILENSMESEVSLVKESETLQMYLQLESLRFKGKFSYQLDAAPEVDMMEEKVPPMIIQPFIENAIWHGIMKKSPQEGHVHVYFYYEDEYLIAKIEDNGVGRAKAQAIEAENKSEKKSMGIGIIEERIRILNQQTQKRMRIEIEDLFDENSLASGTRILIYLDRKYKK